MRFRCVIAFALAFIVTFGAAACGGPAATTEEVAAPKPKPRNAADIARAIVGAKVGALVYVDRTRKHPVGAKVAALDLWQPVLEGTGIDPQRDLERAFVASPSVRSGDKTIAVAQHSLPEDRIKSAIDVMIGRSSPPGEWLEGTGVPAAKVTVREQTRVVAIVDPAFLVILPEANALDAKRFVGTGGFPDPEGPEAVVAFAADPSRSLRAPNAPRIPETISSARATVTLSSDGGADIKAVAQSSSEEQARADAEALTSEIDRATTLKIVFVKVRFFGPIEFKPEGSTAKSDVHLTPGDIDKLMTLLAAVLPK
jgi:hypothetical protein